jgi:hypothetical protein
MVFVDADHRGSEVEQDIVKWLPSIVPGGFIVFHDYGNPDFPEVELVVEKEMIGIGHPVLLAGNIKAFRVYNV